MWAWRSSAVALALLAGACTTGFEGFDVAAPDGGNSGGAATATSSSAAVGGGGATSSGAGTGGALVDAGSPGGGGAGGMGGTGGLGSGGGAGGGAPPTSCDDQYMGAPGYVLCQELTLSCEFNLDANGMTSCDDVCHDLGGECLYAGDNADDCRYTVGTAQCSDDSWSTVLCGCSRGCGFGPPCMPGQTCTMGLCL